MPIRCRNSGGKRKLSAENTASASSFERRALLVRRHRRQRIAPGAGEVAHVGDAADVLGGELRRARRLAQARVEAAAQHVVAARPARAAVASSRAHSSRESFRRRVEVGQRIGAEVELARRRVEPGERTPRRTRTRAADRSRRARRCGRAPAPPSPASSGCVRVLDRPVVVGPERRLVVLALALAVQREVDRRGSPSPSRRGRSRG